MVSYKGEWYEGTHKAIIDKETFEKTQSILAECDEDANSRISRINAPLAWMIRCGHCGNIDEIKALAQELIKEIIVD